MKRFAPLLLCLLVAATTFAQVGINTTDPTGTLDVNGTIRVRGIKSGLENLNAPTATKIVGIDNEGNMVEVEVAENIILENNQLSVIGNKERVSEPFSINIASANNVNLIIWPGEPNDDKSVIKITSLLGNVSITGIAAGQDGQTIWLFPVSGKLTLRPNSALSLLGNQILSDTNAPIAIDRYRMVKLMYDGSLQKWVIVSNY